MTRDELKAVHRAFTSTPPTCSFIFIGRKEAQRLEDERAEEARAAEAAGEELEPYFPRRLMPEKPDKNNSTKAKETRKDNALTTTESAPLAISSDDLGEHQLGDGELSFPTVDEAPYGESSTSGNINVHSPARDLGETWGSANLEELDGLPISPSTSKNTRANVAQPARQGKKKRQHDKLEPLVDGDASGRGKRTKKPKIRRN